MSNQTQAPKTDFERIMEFGDQLKAEGVPEKQCEIVTQYCALSLTSRDEYADAGQGEELLRLEVLTKKLESKLLKRADAFLREIVPLRTRLPLLNDKFSDIVREPVGIMELIEQLPSEVMRKGYRRADLAFFAQAMLEHSTLSAVEAAKYGRRVN